MDMLGHQFYMCSVDAETEEIAVVYKRHNGGYGFYWNRMKMINV